MYTRHTKQTGRPHVAQGSRTPDMWHIFLDSVTFQVNTSMSMIRKFVFMSVMTDSSQNTVQKEISVFLG